MGQMLVLHWSQEQIAGAQQALNATAQALRKLKKNADKTKQVRSRISQLYTLYQAKGTSIEC